MRLRLSSFAAFLLVAAAVGCSKDHAASTSTTTGASTIAATGTKGAAASWVVVEKGGDLSALVKAEVAKAATAGKKPVVYVGAAWCPPCAAIKKYKGDPQMVAAFEGTYIIELDLDDWPAADLAALRYEAKTIPIFITVDKDGKAKGPTIDGGAWGDNIPANMAPPLTKFFASI